MAYAIGCIGTSTEQRTKVRTMTKEQRAKNNSLIPKLRNQSRDIAFIEITSGDLGDGKSGHLTKVRAVKNGQLGHYASAGTYAWQANKAAGPFQRFATTSGRSARVFPGRSLMQVAFASNIAVTNAQQEAGSRPTYESAVLNGAAGCRRFAGGV
jgi:hypothetical protein